MNWPPATEVAEITIAKINYDIKLRITVIYHLLSLVDFKVPAVIGANRVNMSC